MSNRTESYAKAVTFAGVGIPIILPFLRAYASKSLRQSYTSNVYKPCRLYIWVRMNSECTPL